MMHKITTSDKTIFVLLALYLAAMLARFIPVTFLTECASILICCAACIYWMVSISERILEKRQRITLFHIGAMILFLHVSQLSKYDIFSRSSFAMRHFWYAYYLPVLALPLLSLLMSLFIGLPEKKMPNPLIYMLLIPCVIMMILVQTNDLHGLVFSFPEGIEQWDKVYSRGIPYYLVMVWTYLIVTFSFVIAARKCYKVIPFRYVAYVLTIPILHYALTIILYSDTASNLEIFGTVPITVPMLYNMTYIMLWELMIHMGLVPSNSDYGSIFNLSGVSAVITDSDGTPVYKSESSANIPNIFKDATGSFSVLLDDSRKIYSRLIPGGRIFWEEDFSSIVSSNRELSGVMELLSENNALLIEEANIREAQARLNVKKRVYDKISENTREPLSKIDSLLNGAENLPDESFREKMTQVTLPGAFIKRYSNLILMDANNQRITPHDLLLSLSENLSYLELMGITCSGSLIKNGATSNALMIRTYRIMDTFLETVSGYIRSVRILLDVSDGATLTTTIRIKDTVSQLDVCSLIKGIADAEKDFDIVLTPKEEKELLDVTFHAVV